jgi:RNA polymerase sigma-70 factor (ECF subfamily)
MTHAETTRVSLLVRVRDPKDEAAWLEFVALYAPLIHRCAKRFGLQEADADDVTQDVLRTTVRTMPAFEYDARRGRFRGWLRTLTMNQVRDHLSRGKRPGQGTGDTGMHQWLKEQQDNSESDEEFWEREYRERLFQWAAERVKALFREATWRAFEETTLAGRPAEEVASELGLSVGAVYIAKSRVLAKLKEEVETRLGENF